MVAPKVAARPSRTDRNTAGKGLGAHDHAAHGRLRGAEPWIPPGATRHWSAKILSKETSP